MMARARVWIGLRRPIRDVRRRRHRVGLWDSGNTVRSVLSTVLSMALLAIVWFLLPAFQSSGDCCIPLPIVKVPRLRHFEDAEPVSEAPLLQVTRKWVHYSASPEAQVLPDGSIIGLEGIVDALRSLRKRSHTAVINLEIAGDVPAGVVKAVMKGCATAGYSEIGFLVRN